MDTDNDSPSQRLTPDIFLSQVADAEPGWSDRYGGPAGVVTLCAGLQERLMDQSEQIAAVRVAAIRELLKTHSGREVAAMFAVSPAAISKANNAAAWGGATW
jgi:hypothetical protein